MDVKNSCLQSFAGKLTLVSLFFILCSSSAAIGQAIPDQARQSPQAQPALPSEPTPQGNGKITGTVSDQSGVHITGAIVKLTRDGESAASEVTTDEDGKFYFFNLAPGSFKLTFSSAGLAPQEVSGSLSPGESYVTPAITMAIATQVTEVQVTLTPDQIATEEIKEQEKQRVLGFIPNFWVSYSPNPAPLRPKHKFELAWKSTTDPVTLAAVAMVAGFAQAGDRWGAYGQGAEGYAKRFGATYADMAVGTYLGGAILPSLLKQDPRYFYKGTGTKRSRLFYALDSVVICKGDNGRWQPNYSTILGNMAAGGISNLYYPAQDRNAAGVVIGTALIRMGEIAVANVFQEFLIPKLTPNLRTRAPSQP